MRTIYLLAMCLWLNACTATPLFPPEITKDIKTDISVIKAWKEQASYNSGVNFISTKVQLGGRITQVIPKPGGVVILAEEQPIDRYLGYGPINVEREGAFRFAIVFAGYPDDDMLKVGNQFAVVGEMDGSRLEASGTAPRVVLPHLLAQCLLIWKTERFETDTFPYEGMMGYYPLEKRTFCRKEDKGMNLSTANDRRFRVPRSTSGLQQVDHGASAHGLPAAVQSQDISLGKY
jgi:starvation-inducible outer membrane lipoprotein